MTSINPDPLTPEAPGAWHSTLDGWVAETMLAALRRVDAAVLEWRELPLWEHSEPTANVNLASDFDLVRQSNVGVHLRHGMLGVSGWTLAHDREWSFDMFDDRLLTEPLSSLTDREGIAKSIRLWIERIENAPRQDEKLIEDHRRRLGELVAGAAHLSLSSWAGLTLEPSIGKIAPRLWDEDAQPGFCPDPIEYCCSGQLLKALTAARDPFVHLRQDLRFGSHIRIRVGGAEKITVRNDGRLADVQRLVKRLPPGAAVSRYWRHQTRY